MPTDMSSQNLMSGSIRSISDPRADLCPLPPSLHPSIPPSLPPALPSPPTPGATPPLYPPSSLPTNPTWPSSSL
jgi:hypothetical protein